MNIKEARQDLKLSQKAVFDLIGVPVRTLQDWEAGKRKCPAYVEKLVIEKLYNLKGEAPAVEVLNINVEDVVLKYNDKIIKAKIQDE